MLLKACLSMPGCYPYVLVCVTGMIEYRYDSTGMIVCGPFFGGDVVIIVAAG